MDHIVLATVTTLEGALTVGVSALAGTVAFLFRYYNNLLERRERDHAAEIRRLNVEHQKYITKLLEAQEKHLDEAISRFTEENDNQREHGREVLSHICRQFVDKLDQLGVTNDGGSA